jgi:protein-disulfide isomerase
MTRLRTLLELVSLVLTIAACGAILYVVIRDRQTPSRPEIAGVPMPTADLPLPSELASLDGAQLEGNSTATIAVIEFSDFQCPYCGRFAVQTFPQFEKEFVQAGKVLFAFRQFPLESIHPFALSAAKATECAGEQGQFWKMHMLTFADQAHLDDAALHNHAVKAAVNVEQFEKCLRGDVEDRIRADEQAGKRMLVSGTPTFFLGTVQVNGRVKVLKRLSGAVPFGQFKSAIEAVMSAAGTISHKSN